MTRNPVLNATLPKEEHQKREIWTAETLMHALEVCDDDILALAINLSFACSLRMGEMLGLTWDCIDISEESLKENNASIFVDKELQRVNRDVMEVLDNKDIIRVFPRTLSNTNTSLVLKTPKTKTSVRKIFLPSTVAQMLLERKKQIDEMKELFGDEYLDYDLVFCHSSGRPMEGQVINRALKKLIQDNDLPDVVFHSFRHASITYKLKWNGGDMKSVQGDSGHARMDMVADVYSHIIDEDRRYNAQKFEEQFYNAKGLKNAEEGKTAPMKVQRRAKFIIIDTTKGSLLVHLGRTGHFSVLDYKDVDSFEFLKHDHFALFLDNKKAVVLNDQRRFGLVQ